jgi:hypothetical protein
MGWASYLRKVGQVRGIVLLKSLLFTAVISALLTASPVVVRAQSSNSADGDAAAAPATSNGNTNSAAASQNSSCSAFSLQSTLNLTFKQRNCYFARQLFSPMNAASIVAFSLVEQLRDSPSEKRNDWSLFPHRVGTHYARQSARDSAEMLVGYLHHEDPRPRKSLERSFFRRTNAAIMSVLTSPDESGNLRPAFAPMAGSLSSAFVGSAMYTRKDAALSSTMIHAGAVYSFYFVKAIFAEFKPEMDSMVRHILHQ